MAAQEPPADGNEDLRRALLNLAPADLISVISPALRKVRAEDIKNLDLDTTIAMFSYAAVGALIEEHSPYHKVGEANVTPKNVRVGGHFKDKNPVNGLYKLATDGVIPDPASPATPASMTWYFHPDLKPRDIGEGKYPGAGNSDDEYTLRIVKSVQFEYGPNIDGGHGDHPPHIAILFCGADSGGP